MGGRGRGGAGCACAGRQAAFNNRYYLFWIFHPISLFVPFSLFYRIIDTISCCSGLFQLNRNINQNANRSSNRNARSRDRWFNLGGHLGRVRFTESTVKFVDWFTAKLVQCFTWTMTLSGTSSSPVSVAYLLSIGTRINRRRPLIKLMVSDHSETNSWL